jgi:transcriptional regulator with GAF, ATPase, and Fis domain
MSKTRVGTVHASAAQAPARPGDVLTLEALERTHIVSVLKKTHGVIEGPNGAARLLNLKPSTARFRMKKLGITKPDYS